MFDANKLEKYYNHVLSQVYAEGDSPFHLNLTRQVVEQIIKPLGLPHDANILDVGCGPGYFLDAMAEAGYTGLTGITYSQEDLAACTERGHRVIPMDISFIEFENATVDFLFSRHSLEHSPFPYLTLLEYNRVLHVDGLMYVEVPAPNCERQHEYNPNHYSILGARQWHALFLRSGFVVQEYRDLNVNLVNSETGDKYAETYYMFVLRKQADVDYRR